MRTTDLDTMTDEQLKELYSNGSGTRKYFDAIAEANAVTRRWRIPLS